MRTLFLLPLVALALPACMGGGTENRTMESVHQPIVSRTDYVFDMPSRTSPADRARLSEWFRSLDLAYGDRVSVDDPSGSASNRGEVAELASYYGAAFEPVAPVTQGNIPPGNIRVIVSRTKAEVPGCPDWSRPSNPTFDNHAMSNYGCATNANLAAMVANPEDLVSGKEKAPTGYNKLGARRARDNRGGN